MPDSISLIEKLRRGDPLDPSEVSYFLEEFHARRPGITEELLTRWHAAPGQSGYRMLLETIEAPEDQTIVDLACGSGPLARLAATAVGPHGKVYGVDPSRDELALARARNDSPNLSFLEESAQRLSIATSSADAVLCHLALNLLSPIEPAIAEIARVLKPGGIFSAVLFGGEGCCPAFRAVRRLLDRTMHRLVPGITHTAFGDARALSEVGLASLFTPDAGFARFSVVCDFELKRGDEPPALSQDILNFFYSTTALTNDERGALAREITTVLSSFTGHDGVAWVLIPQRLITARRHLDGAGEDIGR